MIPPVVQPGDEFQRVRMPDREGVDGESLRVASVTGNLVQLEWSSQVAAEDLLSEPISMTKIDIETGIIEAQRKDGAGIKLKKKDPAKDAWVWTDWQAVQLFALSNGSFIGVGSSAIGFFS